MYIARIIINAIDNSQNHNFSVQQFIKYKSVNSKHYNINIKIHNTGIYDLKTAKIVRL